MMLYRTILFLVLNFLALAIGGIATGKGVTSDWYVALNRAPWTPPGWVFGAAWTTIMICFAFYMAYAYDTGLNKSFIVGIYALQWVLNVAWNPVFFTLHKTNAALLIIVLLTALVVYFLFSFFSELKVKSLLILPYVIWMFIATSLNAYICIKN